MQILSHGTLSVMKYGDFCSCITSLLATTAGAILKVSLRGDMQKELKKIDDPSLGQFIEVSLNYFDKVKCPAIHPCSLTLCHLFYLIQSRNFRELTQITFWGIAAEVLGKTEMKLKVLLAILLMSIREKSPKELCWYRFRKR